MRGLLLLLALLLTGCRESKPPVVTFIKADANTVTFHVDRLDPGESVTIPVIIEMSNQVNSKN